MSRSSIAALIGAGVLFPAPASASGSAVVHGTIAGQNAIVDSKSGGSPAHFLASGEHLYACDTKADGMRAVAFASWTGVSGVQHRAEVQDIDGANGNCAGHADLDIVEGVFIWITACERNGQYGEPQNCDSKGAVS